ncbi:MAG TPA: bacterial ammonia monooxygenase, subunit AmoB [Burkholderiales bacterium]|nr:bacterial ammonia monooxygenase, subunit AmoB [Burkholderiales bacterium]
MRSIARAPGRVLPPLIFVLMCAQALPASAHGERAQEPYLRTRTAHWYDVKWSTDKLAVNDTITVTGKFRLFHDWPDAVKPPDTVFVSNATPGPVFARVDSYLNGVPARQSFRDLQIGRDYEYKMVLQGRVPGRYHVHPMIAVKGSGPLVGPGKWIEVTGNQADFTYPLKAISGENIDNLETWGLSTAVKWHLILLAIAAAWILWWIRRPLLIPRYIALKKEREDLLTTNVDLAVAIGLLVVVVALSFGGYAWARSKYPRTVPLQAGTMYTAPLPAQPKVVDIRFKEARYDVPGRSMRMTFEVTNVSDKPLRLGEFATASIRFINQNLPAARANVAGDYPHDVVARTGLMIVDDTEIKPGETRTLKVDATDAAWEIERLTSFLTDVDSKFGGLLFFFDPQGNRYIAEVGGPILPVFRKSV